MNRAQWDTQIQERKEPGEQVLARQKEQEKRARKLVSGMEVKKKEGKRDGVERDIFSLAPSPMPPPNNPLAGYVGPARPVEESHAPLLSKMEEIVVKMSAGDITNDEVVEYQNLFERLKYENRIRRFKLAERIYNVINAALDSMEMVIMSGEPLDLSPNQLRLLTQMFMDQNREEFGDKSPDTIIDQRQQTITMQIVEVHKDYGEGNSKGQIVDGKVVG